MNVVPSEITSEARDFQSLYGVCWNTEDDFDQDNVEYTEITEFHRSLWSSALVFALSRNLEP